MSNRITALVVPVSVLVTVLGAVAPVVAAPVPDATVGADARRAPAPAAVSPLARVAVVGASATAGFGVRLDVGGGNWYHADLGRALASVLAEEGVEVSTHGNIFFFRSPRRTGGSLLRRALRDDPTVVVAADFLFWFGYGDRAADGTPMRDEAQRLELLEKGLAMLDRVQCPIVVGDFPDMSAAVGRMIGPRQMPAPDTLVRLNARVHEWISARPGRTLVPLARTLRNMRTGAVLIRGDGTPLDLPERPMLQGDELHPTGDGLVALARIVADVLVTALEGAEADDLVPTHDAAVERLRRAIAPPGLPAAEPTGAVRPAA